MRKISRVISIFTFLFLIRPFLIVCKAWPTSDFLTATKEKKSFTSINPISSFFTFLIPEETHDIYFIHFVLFTGSHE
jgi:hypothetical protein